ncbi:PDZ domain-containing protein [Bacillus rubiinfantis]|uniref:PDZ domain-containing protein n=1 Tax=Bacillus rubiinfantis TaxID=1499680 RepID=UPI00319E1F26
MQIWLMEVLKGTAKLFLHPVLYYLIFLAGILGVLRVKRERKNFHIRAQNAYYELRQLFPLGLLLGLLCSVIVVATGIVVPLAAIILTAGLTILLSLTTNIRWMSPAYTIGLAFFAVILFAENQWTVPFFARDFAAIEDMVYPSIVVILGLLLVAEGILIVKNGTRATSPKLAKSKRGQVIGIHEARRLWLVPVFMLIPGEMLHLPFAWWPVFHVGGNEYSLILVPFAIGFHQQMKGILPTEGVARHGRQVLLLGVVILLLAAASYWYHVVAIVTAAIAIIGRETVAYIAHVQDENRPVFFSKKNHGLMILGIIPDSPASKMGLQVGEIIAKVNGTSIQDEHAFYEALQKNRAHCKLDVLDTNGEVRFVQRALFEGDHHELGLLFVHDERQFDKKIG